MIVNTSRLIRSADDDEDDGDAHTNTHTQESIMSRYKIPTEILFARMFLLTLIPSVGCSFVFVLLLSYCHGIIYVAMSLYPVCTP